ncbi:bifunctional diguanylate cyclase/phosphodiesterase [Planosporangium thailandense]|uniref:Bifunctional diguanylate cyclase/phosphodiesterase n=1 Tax=Planosporangium thailandense TaxID=765197 RepID=A0ABX0XSY1_9ACTN|nr:bifunctional diguanylate cyclase/phosphodiesterase [Planosporangium thailandense]NJC68560.1 bifunctional diguanylate cyclase/phosphodiesterase [Planosporangium thailandense]
MLRLSRTPSPASPPGPRSAVPAWAFLAFGGLAAVLYAVVPVALTPPLFLAVAVASIVATAIGARRHQVAGVRRPWWAMVAAETLFLGGAVLRAVIPGVDATPPGPAALIPDVLVVPGYLCWAYAVIDMLRRRRPTKADPAAADALLIGLGATLVVWVFLLGPRIAAAPESTASQVAAAFFPVVDVVLMVFAAQLMFADAARVPALWLLGASATVMFVGDLMYAVHEDGVDSGSPLVRLFDIFSLLAYAMMAAAALHPTMRTLTERQSVALRYFGIVRTAGIATVLVTPTVLAMVAPPSTGWNGAVRLALSFLLTVTVVIRLVRANNSQTRAERAARHRATHDALTDLPNRELLTETISRLSEADEGQEITLLFIDLDRFKMVNDSWGHAVGDELLCAVAARLRTAVRGEDLVCRVGGDEFVVLIASTTDSSQVASLTERLLDDFAEPFDLSVGSVVITPSIGVASSDGATEALELIRDADTAMYKAKSSGRNGYAFFDQILHEQVRTRVEIEQALRGALDRGELSVHYQPIVDLANDELTGFEALMRWDHPQLGRVSPLEFIPIAEDTGLIVEYGAWLLEEAANQLVRWRAARADDLPPLHISVNISVRQLRDSALVGVVRRALRRTGLPASTLWLEITESGVMEDPETALATLRALRALGVRLAIDDFGTGYASLNYLRSIPARIVKIDRSFVAGVGEGSHNEAIVKAVVAMAHALGQRVVAEGVETVVQRDWLRAYGCDLVQGWLYGAPRSADAQVAWMDRTATALQLDHLS